MRKLVFIAALASASVAGAAAILESKPAAGTRAPIEASRPSAVARVATLKVENVGCISCALLRSALFRVSQG
jgi:hypothetical protein